jgi:hypothetical protein
VSKIVGKAEGRGRDLSYAMLQEIIAQNILLLPYFTIVTIAKYLGFKLGQIAVNFSPQVQMLFSSQKWYWKSKYFKREINS